MIPIFKLIINVKNAILHAKHVTEHLTLNVNHVILEDI